MILTGISYEVEGLDEWTDEITEATVSNSKITLTWQDDDGPYFAELFSDDGTYYCGKFGLRRIEQKCVIEGMRFQSKAGDTLLWLTWHRDDTGFGGTSIMHLHSEWEEE